MPQSFALLRRLSSEQPLTCTVDFNFHSLKKKKKKAQVEKKKEQKKMGFLLDNYKKLQKKQKIDKNRRNRHVDKHVIYNMLIIRKLRRK